MNENSSPGKMSFIQFHLVEKKSQLGAKINTIFRLSLKSSNRIIIKNILKACFALSIKIMLCYLKFRFKQ